MKHIFDLPQFGENWFSYQTLYSNFVKNLPNNSKIVELGCWKGKSVAYLAVEIINSNKNIKIDAIDIWTGEINNDISKQEPDLYNLFLSNIEPVKHIINPIRMDSTKAAELYENESVDAVFIDASHDYESVKNDILAWYPKIKNNGYIAGHDYYHPPVKRAVDETLSDKGIIHNLESEGCFLLQKKSSKNKVYEIFMFTDEFDLLDLKLTELNDVVDYFIIVEANKTFTGIDKELQFEKNKERYKKYNHKIIHLICDYNSDLFVSYCNEYRPIFNVTDNWLREFFQRDFPIFSKKIKFEENDILIVTDVDEIINKKSLSTFLNNNSFFNELYRFDMYLFHYFVNTNLYINESNEDKKWHYPVLCKFHQLKDSYESLSYLRIYQLHNSSNYKLIENGGWHFSYLMNVESIFKKINSFTHTNELNISVEQINNSIKNLKIFYDKNETMGLKEFPFALLPDTIKNNKESWKNNFWHKKDLIIIGCHPSSIKNENILKECINSLSFDFDIALVSHFPINEEIQKMVKYIFYEKENEFINLGSLLIWEKNDLFNYQLHIKNKKDYSYSVLKNILNGVNFLKSKYTSFFYIENDCIFDKDDIDKLKSLKSENKKSSFFIREDNFIHTLCFYSDINFFLKNISHFLNKDDYLNFCKNEIKYKYPVIENFLYYTFLKNQVLNEINFIKNHPAHFFDKSQIDIVGVPLNEYDYPIYLVSLKNENRLFLLYLNKRTTKFDKDKKLSIYLDDTHLFDLNVGTYNFWCEIFPYNENFSISVNDKSQTFNKTDLCNDKLNYIEFL